MRRVRDKDYFQKIRSGKMNLVYKSNKRYSMHSIIITENKINLTLVI